MSTSRVAGSLWLRAWGWKGLRLVIVRGPRPPLPHSPGPFLPADPWGAARAPAFCAGAALISQRPALALDLRAARRPPKAFPQHPTLKPVDSLPLAASSTPPLSVEEYTGGAHRLSPSTSCGRPPCTPAPFGGCFAAVSTICSNSSVSSLSCCRAFPSIPAAAPPIRFSSFLLSESFNAGPTQFLSCFLTEYFSSPFVENFNSLETFPFSPLVYFKNAWTVTTQKGLFLQAYPVQHLMLEVGPSEAGDLPIVNGLVKPASG